LFSLWQESKCKDIGHFFGVFKKKFNFFTRPIRFAFIEDIIDAFYCCIILHNAAVKERIELNNGSTESHSFYECVDNAIQVEADAAQSQCSNSALWYVQLDEEHVQDIALEVEYLNALGIPLA
jgi:hypothetical protein